MLQTTTVDGNNNKGAAIEQSGCELDNNMPKAVGARHEKPMAVGARLIAQNGCGSLTWRANWLREPWPFFGSKRPRKMAVGATKSN